MGEPIDPHHGQRLEDTAAYLVRSPLSLKKLVYLDGEKAVIYSRMNPSIGRNFEAMDPLEGLARLSDHSPDPGQQRTLFYGEYSSRVRGAAASSQPEAEAGEEHEPRRRASPSWGRLTMPSAGLCCRATREPFGWRRSQLSARHNHSPSKKASRVSGGR